MKEKLPFLRIGQEKGEKKMNRHVQSHSAAFPFTLRLRLPMFCVDHTSPFGLLLCS